MHEIILKKFDEWTKDLGPKESRIKIFEKIRDIPFSIIPTNLENAPVELLLQNKGSCLPKHSLLGILFQKLEIPVKYAVYSFRWSDQGIDYPEKLKKTVGRLPMDHHIACKACINDRWILVDATWDLPLKKVGFPVNETWDGFNSTVNAVTPLEESVFGSIQEGLEYVGSRASYTKEQALLCYTYFVELNVWLKEVRTQK